MTEKNSQNEKKRKFKIVTRGKQYSVKDSPLYNLNKRRFEDCFNISFEKAQLLASDCNYDVFSIKQGLKYRQIHCPRYQLNYFHSRLASLLCRIAPPEYLHSGVKKRSSVTNAIAHKGNHPVLTLDIKSFFDSVSTASIYFLFSETFNIHPEVAGVLAEICSINGHLPTGSRISLPLSFMATQKLYATLSNYCENKKIVMTVYVDDLTFSGKQVNPLSKKHLIKIIETAGYSVNHKKTNFYPAHVPKLITGVVIRNNQHFVRNKHQKSIFELLNQLPTAESEEHLREMQAQLVGRLNAAAQVEPRFNQIRQKLSSTPATREQ